MTWRGKLFSATSAGIAALALLLAIGWWRVDGWVGGGGGRADRHGVGGSCCGFYALKLLLLMLWGPLLSVLVNDVVNQCP